MQVSITFRHMDASDALRTYIDSRITGLEKYLVKPTDVRVVLSVEKFRHRAEVVLLEQNFKASADETTDDMYKTIDKAIEKIEKQVKKHKSKVQAHHKHSLQDVAVQAEKEYKRKTAKQP
ncbi:MAG: ribosome-associated translation inhibitor RaiA [Deltaproteobacteria bacterium]|nr:ribosome-associated translation inhibitor RaiA [Deltaproteobacteria bacterium]